MLGQVWKHESIKSSNSLVGATVCMMAGILSHQVSLTDEFNVLYRTALPCM